MMEIASVMLLSHTGTHGVVYYQGERYFVELGCLDYDPESERYNINKAYLTRESKINTEIRDAQD